MTIQDLKQMVIGRPGRARSAASRPALHAAAHGPETQTTDDRLTWWDLMSDLDAGWLAWSEHLDNAGAHRRVA